MIYPSTLVNPGKVMGVPVFVDIKAIVMIERGVALNVGIGGSLKDRGQRARTDNLLEWNTLVVSAVVSTSFSHRIKARVPTGVAGDFCETLNISHLARTRIVG